MKGLMILLVGLLSIFECTRTYVIEGREIAISPNTKYTKLSDTPITGESCFYFFGPIPWGSVNISDAFQDLRSQLRDPNHGIAEVTIYRSVVDLATIIYADCVIVSGKEARLR